MVFFVIMCCTTTVFAACLSAQVERWSVDTIPGSRLNPTQLAQILQLGDSVRALRWRDGLEQLEFLPRSSGRYCRRPSIGNRKCAVVAAALWSGLDHVETNKQSKLVSRLLLLRNPPAHPTCGHWWRSLCLDRHKWWCRKSFDRWYPLHQEEVCSCTPHANLVERICKRVRLNYIGKSCMYDSLVRFLPYFSCFRLIWSFVLLNRFFLIFCSMVGLVEHMSGWL